LRFEPLEDRRLLAVTLGFTGPYAVSNWTSTGIAGGTTSLEPASGDSLTGSFGYDVTLPFGTGVSPRTADFTLASSPVTGLVTFDYTYTGNHRFFEATAGFSTLVNGGAAPLVDNVTTSGDFNFTGSATLLAHAGQSFGFRIGGEHLDFDSHIDGTLSITNIKFFDSIVVDSVSDTVDGDYSPGNLTLREAIDLANTISGANTITFAESMSGQTILLGGTQLEIAEAVTIDATTLAENVAIDAQQQSRVMNFGATTGDLTLAGLTIQNGRTTGNGSSGFGGGIRFGSSGVLTLNRSTLSGNSTTGSQADGGGIYTDFGDVALNQSTLSRNSATDGLGGGIATFGGDVTINQSTISGNSTAGTGAVGGGIHAFFGDVTLNQSTLSGNSTTGTNAHGGGIFSYFGVVTIRNSIVAGNSVGVGSTGPDLVAKTGNDVIVNFSLIGTGITPTSGDNNISTDDPKLGPLANNGGPTQTHALLPGSPALDAGDPNGGAVHAYDLNGSLADALGGPSLVVGGGFLTDQGYVFGPNQGANLNNVVAADEYSIELVFSFDALGGYQKIIDFHDLADDAGLYSSGNNLEFFPAAVAENVLTAGTPTHLVVTRDAATDVVAIYLNGEQVMQFVDSGDIAVFNGLANVIRLFSDDNVSGGTEVASGFLDRIRIYDRDLSAAEVAGLVFDQRGAPFVRVFGGRLDIGALEAISLVVNDAGGGSDSNIANGVTTLREAINFANAASGADVITFDPEMSGHVILLGGSQLEITDALTIDASTLDENVIIDAQQQSRVVNFTVGAGDLTLAGLTMLNGRTTAFREHGGGISFASSGVLTLNRSTVSGSSTAGSQSDGGGIYTDFGDVVLNQSTLSRNSATDGRGGGIATFGGDVTITLSTLSENSTINDFRLGGAIFNQNGNVTLIQSTVSGNSTAGEGSRGGAIYVLNGSVTLNHSTLSGNSTAGTNAHGGGIFSESSFGDVTIHNSIFAGNMVAASSTGPELVAKPGNDVIVNFSLIGTGITPTAGGNNIVTNTPLLGPLADNGGPTQTHALLPGSPALDAGDPNGATSNAVHVYELDNSGADELGGPSLVVGGGFFSEGSYFFGPNQGANLNSAITPDEYSIELVFAFDALGGYQKIIDFKDLTDDTGLYSTGPNLDFFGGAFAADVLSPGVSVHLVVTRDAATDVVAVYVDGMEVLSFVDTGGIAVFNGIAEVVRFFQDDNVTGGAEAASGFVDRIRIYDRDLSAAEVAGLVFDQRGTPFVRVFDGDGVGGARIDVGAFESNVELPALWGDYNNDGFVNAADYTLWRNTLGTTGLEPYDGADGSGDGTIGPEDYGVWKSNFGESLQGAGGGAAALALTEPVVESDAAIVAPPAESIAAPAAVKVDAVRVSDGATLAARSARHDSAAPPRKQNNSFRVVESARDQLLLLLASDRLEYSSRQDSSVIHDRGNDDHHADDLVKQDLLDDPLALALAEWP
jgi:hypothetical protein